MESSGLIVNSSTNDANSWVAATTAAGMTSVVSVVMAETSPSNLFMRSPVWCLCRCNQSHRNSLAKTSRRILLRTLLPVTACIHLLAARDVICANIRAAITMPVTASEPSLMPVAMSMACLQASTHNSWQATSSNPIPVFMAACLRAPLELRHNQKNSLFVDMFFSLLPTLLNL